MAPIVFGRELDDLLKLLRIVVKDKNAEGGEIGIMRAVAGEQTLLSCAVLGGHQTEHPGYAGAVGQRRHQALTKPSSFVK